MSHYHHCSPCGGASTASAVSAAVNPAFIELKGGDSAAQIEIFDAKGGEGSIALRLFYANKPADIAVYINGVRLTPGVNSDYSVAADRQTVQFTEVLEAGDVVLIQQLNLGLYSRDAVGSGDTGGREVFAQSTQPQDEEVFEGAIWRDVGNSDSYIRVNEEWHQLVTDERLASADPSDPATVNGGFF